MNMLKKTGTIYRRSYFYLNSTRNFAYVKSNEFYKKDYNADDTMRNVMQNSKINSLEDWRTIRQEIFRTSRTVTPQNIDAVTLNFCATQKRYDLADSYLEFMKSESIMQNLATMGKYFKLHYLKYQDSLLNEGDEQNILNLYKELRQNYKVLDSITGEHVILGLSVTKQWKDCLNLLDDIKISCTPNGYAYSALVSAAFSNNENVLAWQLLEEMIDNNRYPQSVTYISYLQQINDTTLRTEAIKKLDHLLNFFGHHDIQCNKNVIDKLYEVTKNINRTLAVTKISKKGVCVHCVTNLRRFNLTEEEFTMLKAAFFDRVLIGRNVFNKTTPEELKRFKSFIETMKKYDVIIDGLNVAYSIGVKQPPHILSMLLSSVVRHFVQQNKTVLVLGRKHMSRWPKQNLQYITNNATMFLTDDLSHDDPYLLYCALNSGLDTVLVSRDLMRTHLHLLKDVHHRKLFSRWLAQSQYQLLHVNMQGKAFFKAPLPYVVTAQKHENYWHIPCEEDSPKNVSNFNDQWICLKL